ncbi:MAG: COQ9 family protein [Alphaproteobacteria bacterium]|nr:COQ9 family protein [Alphaproteobacteria bacterium]
MDKNHVCDIRDHILEALLPAVPFDGWRWSAVCTAALSAGYEEGMPKAVFPEGISDVLSTFSDRADLMMLESLKALDPEEMRVRDRVREALVARYTYLQPHKEAVRQSALFWAVPWRKPQAAKIIWRTADRIWDWAGDTASDYNRYTKRGLLSGIIVPTTLVWLNDGDEAMDETKAFLDRRIENVMQLNRVLNQVKRAS